MYNIARPELTATNIKFIHGDVLPIEYSPEVVDALNNHKPIVALESTIVTHGMPYPENVNTAKEVQQIIRDAGATPATIAIMDQKIYIGLTDKQLDQLGQAGKTANKTSRRDIPLVLAKPGAIGGTTVSATMILAERAGIRVFATGGIGGVHRGAAETMDISSDLTELGRTPVTVVCAGVKSILDIELTMEYLETQGVTVVGFQTDHVPAFFSPSSGIPIHARVESAEEVAQLIIYNRIMKLESGIVVAVPIPADSVTEVKAIQSHIDEAVRISKEQKIKGKDITPFLLEKVNELSNGTSLAANIHLVKNNARVAAEIAIEYSKQTQKIEDNKKK